MCVWGAAGGGGGVMARTSSTSPKGKLRSREGGDFPRADPLPQGPARPGRPHLAPLRLSVDGLGQGTEGGLGVPPAVGGTFPLSRLPSCLPACQG